MCNECGSKLKLIKFKGEPDYIICERCWDEKLDKGYKKHNSYVCHKKHFKYKRYTRK